MKHIKLAAFVFMAMLATAAMTQAQSMKDMKGMGSMHNMSMTSKAKTTTIQGEVVDLACYLTKGQHGAKHEECAQMCINSGLPVGILTKEGKVYVAITAKHKTANDLLGQYAAKQVKVTGTVDSRNGVNIVAIDKVEPVGKN